MDGILGLDDHGTVVTYNQSMERMLGHAKGEVIGCKHLSALSDPESYGAFEATLDSEQFGGPGPDRSV